jgi:hypothetical protein
MKKKSTCGLGMNLVNCHMTRLKCSFPAALWIAMAVSLTSCGSVGSLQRTTNIAPAHKYNLVVVQDFTASVPEDEREKALQAQSGYPDAIAAAICRKAPGIRVTRQGPVRPGTLVVSGHINRCEDGAASLRLWIGMGAGSTYFDAVTQISDGGSGTSLGTIKHDKNSWPLGGIIASTQTVDSFMRMAADKTADEVIKLMR